MGRQFAIALVTLVATMVAINFIISGGRWPSTQVTPSASPQVTASPSPSPAVTPTPRPTPTPAPTFSFVPTPPPPTVRISGQGTANSNTFRLDDTLGYMVQYSLPGSCQYFAYLRSVDGSYNNSDFMSDSGPTSGTKVLRTELSGAYYVAMTTDGGCPWSLTFTPR